jgi:hypothetical protein
MSLPLLLLPLPRREAGLPQQVPLLALLPAQQVLDLLPVDELQPRLLQLQLEPPRPRLRGPRPLVRRLLRPRPLVQGSPGLALPARVLLQGARPEGAGDGGARRDDGSRSGDGGGGVGRARGAEAIVVLLALVSIAPPLLRRGRHLVGPGLWAWLPPRP